MVYLANKYNVLSDPSLHRRLQRSLWLKDTHKNVLPLEWRIQDLRLRGPTFLGIRIAPPPLVHFLWSHYKSLCLNFLKGGGGPGSPPDWALEVSFHRRDISMLNGKTVPRNWPNMPFFDLSFGVLSSDEPLYSVSRVHGPLIVTLHLKTI